MAGKILNMTTTSPHLPPLRQGTSGGNSTFSGLNSRGNAHTIHLSPLSGYSKESISAASTRSVARDNLEVRCRCGRRA